MALAPLSQTLVLTADGSNFNLLEPVVIPSGAITAAPLFTVAASISPGSGTTATTFSASDGVVLNGSVTGRRWLLDGQAIGTGSTINSAAGTLVLEVIAAGPGGTAISTSSAVIVAAIPAPAFSGAPAVSPTTGDTATTFTATDPTIANGTITARAWLIGTTTIGTGPSIVPGVGNDGQLSRKVTAVGTDGLTITTTSTGVTVVAVSTSPTQDNTAAGDTSNKAGNAAWQSRYQTLETRFTALGAA